MNVNSNAYTFGFATVMVLVVAAVLSYIATSLKPMQAENVEKEKMQNILSSIQVQVEREKAPDIYQKYIVEQLVISDGELIEGVDAFKVDMLKEARISNNKRKAPLYVAEKEGETYYIIPLQGTGLWGPIWGYIALEQDLNTVYGIRS